MKRYGFLSIALAAAVTVGCNSNHRNDTNATNPPAGGAVGTAGSADRNVKSGDKDFVHDLAIANTAEIELGRLAAERAANPEVKKFGQMMVDDHSKANDQLSQIAQSKHLTVPQKISSKDQATYDRLSGLTGDAFDRAYIKLMVQDHKKDVQEFKKQSTSGADPELKQFASTTLPTLEKHLQDAESIATRLGQTAATSGTDKKEHATDRPGHPKATTTPTPPQR